MNEWKNKVNSSTIKELNTDEERIYDKMMTDEW